MFRCFKEKYGVTSLYVIKILTLVEMNCSNTDKTYLKRQDNKIKWSFTHLYIDLLVMTGGIEPFLRNVDYPSMLVFLNMFCLNITMPKKN